MQTQPHREEKFWTKAKKWSHVEKKRRHWACEWKGLVSARPRERRKPSAWVGNGNKWLTCPKLRIWLGAGKDHESRKIWWLVQEWVKGFILIIRRWSYRRDILTQMRRKPGIFTRWELTSCNSRCWLTVNYMDGPSENWCKTHLWHTALYIRVPHDAERMKDKTEKAQK